MILKEQWDFILAIGDDSTDEDIFSALPEEAYSIKVGFDSTRAKFYVEYVESVEDVRLLLSELANVKLKPMFMKNPGRHARGGAGTEKAVHPSVDAPFQELGRRRANYTV